MRITHVVHGYPPESIGGTELSVRDLVSAQVQRGDSVEVVAGSLERRSTPEVTCDVQDHVTVTRIHRAALDFDRWDQGACPFVEQAFRRSLRRFRPDVIHVHHWIRLTPTLIDQARREGIPSVVTLHDLYISCPRVFRWPDDRRICTRPLSPASCRTCVPRAAWHTNERLDEEIELYADTLASELRQAGRIFVPTQAGASRLAATTSIPRQALTVRPLAYRPRHPTLITPATRVAGTRLRLGLWGVLSPRKGADLLLEAVRQLHHRGLRDFEVHLFGRTENGEGDRLRTLAQGLPVQFHGAYRFDQLIAANLHVGVIASPVMESYCYAIDEAVELGLPLIAPDSGAFAERLGSRGLLYRRDDAEDLARVIGVIRDETKRRDVAGQPFQASPSPVDAADQLADDYAEVAARGVAWGGPPHDRSVLARAERTRRDRLEAYVAERSGLEAHCRNLEAELQRLRRRSESPPCA